jgi:hypothetical protein
MFFSQTKPVTATVAHKKWNFTNRSLDLSNEIVVNYLTSPSRWFMDGLWGKYQPVMPKLPSSKKALAGLKKAPVESNRFNFLSPIFSFRRPTWTNPQPSFGCPLEMKHGDGSKPCTPVVHIKIAGIYGCSSH